MPYDFRPIVIKLCKKNNYLDSVVPNPSSFCPPHPKFFVHLVVHLVLFLPVLSRRNSGEAVEHGLRQLGERVAGDDKVAVAVGRVDLVVVQALAWKYRKTTV